MNMEAMRVGVIGVGVMGQYFARLLTELPHVRLCGVADSVVEKAQTTGKKYGAPAFSSAEELLNGVDVDAVIIATADNHHVEPVRAAAQAKKPIFLEKPLATTIADGRLILQEVAAADVELMVGHCVRFDPRYAAARTAIRSGKLGQLIHLAARRTSRLTAHRHVLDRCTVSMFLGVHDIDYMLWATGRRVAQVFAAGRRLSLDSTETDASVLSLLTFDDGTIATLETCWAAPMPAWQFEAVGTEGVINITSPEIGSSFYGIDGFQNVNPLYSSEPVVEGQTLSVYQAELMHFFQCLAQNRPFVVQPHEALMAVAVAEAIDRSVASGQAEIPAKTNHER